MKKSPDIRKICFVIGCVLMVSSLLLLIWWQLSISHAEKKSAHYMEVLRTVVPEPEPAIPEERSNNEMPVLSIDGVDFVGILELPAYDVALPVCGDWDTMLPCPSRYSGSVYDGSMIIGATSQQGQFDFYRQISVGDVVYFTDMTGSRFSYKVSEIFYREHAGNEVLESNQATLTLFIKNLYAFEYLILRCGSLT